MDGVTLFNNLLTKRGLNPNSLAAAIKRPTAQSGFYRFRKGIIKQPRKDASIELAAKRLGVNVLAFYDEELAEREWARVEGKKSNPSSVVSALVDDEIRIPQFNTGGKMGHGLVLRDQPGVIREWAVNSEWLRHNVHRITSPSNLAIVTGFGDSMKPLFNSGDPLLVDLGRHRADVDGIYFFRVGDEGFIKRLQRIPTAKGMVLRAKSENPHYDPFDITQDMDFEVFGWVVKAWCGEDF